VKTRPRNNSRRLLACCCALLALCSAWSWADGGPTPVAELRAANPVETWRRSDVPVLPPNYNLHAVVSETLINRILSQSDAETRGVQDRILGANIFGVQMTDTRLSVDCQPAPANMRLMMQLHGITRSNTVGIRQEARINTLGCYRFGVFKPVFFDARMFSTSSAMARVYAHNSNRGVRTPVTGTPLVGPLFDRFVYAAAERQKPQGEAIAARKLAEQVLPRFNRTIDAQLAELNGQLQVQIIEPLQKYEMQPDQQSLVSTDHYVRYSARSPSVSNRPIETSAPPAMPPGNLFCVHESLLALAIDRFEFAGRAFTAQDLRWLTETLQRFGLAREDLSGPELNPVTDLATFVFDEVDPLRIRIDDGEIEVVSRVRIEPAIGNPLPLQQVRVTLVPVLEGDVLTLQPRDIDVRGVDGAVEPGMMLIQGVVRDQVEKLLTSAEFNRTWTPPLTNVDEFSLRLRSLTADDGWLAIEFE